MDVKYIGFIGVKKSMRSLPHKKRSEVARESINRLCEANKISARTIDKKKRLCDISLLEDEPNIENSGLNVQLCITSTHLKLISVETGQVIMQHEMPNVSFASSGDEDTIDFVGYVAKDSNFKRACFVLECCFGTTATTVLDTIARQFQLRTYQILYNNNNSNVSSTPTTPTTPTNTGTLTYSGVNNNNNNSNTPNIDTPTKINNENQRASLENEPWFHGSYLSREASETRLKHDGDFLVRESMLDPGNFVLSVMTEGKKLHLLLDSVRTKTKIFNDIGDLVKYHHEHGEPIVAENRIVYLRNGVRSRG